MCVRVVEARLLIRLLVVYNSKEKRMKYVGLVIGLAVFLGLFLLGIQLSAAEVLTQDREVVAERTMQERLAEGILRWNTIWKDDIKAKDRVLANGFTRWTICGEEVAQDKLMDRALDLAQKILMVVGTYKVEATERVNVWGFAAVIANESGFDYCAVDGQTRTRLYTLGWLRRSPLTLSHQREVLIKILTSKAWKRYVRETNAIPGMRRLGTDLGFGQRRVYSDMITRAQLEQIFDEDNGLMTTYEEMVRRARMYGPGPKETMPLYSRPWRLWPGGGPSEALSKRYDRRISVVAKRLGATKQEFDFYK